MLILNIITFANLLLLFLLLFFKKNNAVPNRILALILLDPGINFISNASVLSGHFFTFPYVFFLAQITCFAFAPLVHMYTALMLGRKINWKHPLYFISAGAMLMVLYFGVSFSLMADGMQEEYLRGIMNEPYPWQMDLTNTVFIVLQQIYFTVAAANVYKYKKRLNAAFSNHEKTRVVYAGTFISLIWIFNLITICLYAVLPMTQVEYLILPLVVTGIYFFILYYTFHHNSIFTKESYQEFLAESPALNSKSKISDDDTLLSAEILLLAQQIEDHLNEKESFVNSSFSLEIFSEEMDIPCAKLSAAINKGLKKNFYDLINEKRVEKAIQLLKNRGNTTTIEYVAYESGFNSRASFYRAFKKHSDITPKEYLKMGEE